MNNKDHHVLNQNRLLTSKRTQANALVSLHDQAVSLEGEYVAVGKLLNNLLDVAGENGIGQWQGDTRRRLSSFVFPKSRTKEVKKQERKKEGLYKTINKDIYFDS